jgi:hypothetical protein
MRALSKLDMSENAILTKEGGKILGDMLKANSVLKELNASKSWMGLDQHQRQKPDGTGFIIALANGINGNGALTSLNLSNNKTATKEAGEAMREMLRSNTALKELDIFEVGGIGFAQGVSKGLANNETVSTITFASELTMKTDMVKANFRGKGAMLGTKGALVIAAFLPKCK